VAHVACFPTRNSALCVMCVNFNNLLKTQAIQQKNKHRAADFMLEKYLYV